MENLKKARRPVRRDFDKLIGELETLLLADKLEEDKIAVKFEMFNDVFESLTEHDNKIIDQLRRDEVKEEEENAEWDEMNEFKLRGKTIRQLKEKLMPTRVLPTLTESMTGSVSNPEIKLRNFKLPTVQLKKFTGELKDWLGFWAQFQKIHEDPHMAASDKFWYLLQSLEPKSDAYEIASGYPQSNENYEIVINALKRQYGNVDLQLQVYIRELLNLVISNVNSKEKLSVKSLFLKLDSHLRALKTLNLEKADPATWLFPLVESCLPESLLYNWQRSGESSQDGSKTNPPKTRLDLLMEFVEKEVAIKQRIDITKNFANQHKSDQVDKNNGNKRRLDKQVTVPTLSSFHSGDNKQCGFCGKRNHDSDSCFTARKMKLQERIQILKKKGLCFRCTGSHLRINCSGEGLQCANCKGKHLTILCRESRSNVDKRHLDNGTGGAPAKRHRSESGVVTVSSSASYECSSDVVLKTLRVKVKTGENEKTVRAFIDDGCQRSYILKRTARQLQMTPTGTEQVRHSLFGDKQTPVVTHNKYEIIIASLNNEYEKKVVVRDQGALCGKLPIITKKFPNLLDELVEKNVKLTDVDADSQEIELLIGADVCASLLTGRVIELNCGAVAIHTKLGWTLLGEVNNSALDETSDSCYCSMYAADTGITKLWDFDVMGITDPIEEAGKRAKEDMVKEKFAENVTRDETGRYIVKFPWRNNLDYLPSNREVAYKRLEYVSKKLLENGLFSTYDKLFQDWESEGFIEKCIPCYSGDKCHYLPHRPVIKDSPTTPVRPVFDASCRVGKSPSLNDCLYTGENYVKTIPDLILRFREKPVACWSDIRKAFQMIGIHPEDRSYMRFLWWTDVSMTALVEYRHARVLFGATCSPFILACVIDFHLTHLPESRREIGQKLLSTFYVDNCLNSEETEEDYQCFRKEATEIMKMAGMDLRLWLSNVDEFDDPANNIISVLGIQWDRIKDELFTNVTNISCPEKTTKRTILSTVQQIFDPIGFTSPATLPMKLLLQRTWSQKLKWDEILPDAENRRFRKWCEELKHLGNIKIPRLSTAGVTDKKRWSLNCFCDASKDSFSSVVFVRVELEKSVKIQLLAAKSRVAPIKKNLTIPKLELMACLIGVRLTNSVKSALKLESVEENYWSDSTTALAWIKRDDQWGTFVSNRTKEIRMTTSWESWRHVPGAINPADLPSRGCFPLQLLQSRWWEGPTWLYERENWPSGNVEVNEEEICAERRKRSTTAVVASFPVFNFKENSHSYDKLVRIIGWIRRFLYNKFLKNPELRRTGHLKPEELKCAEIVFIKNIQRKCFPSERREKITGLEIMEDDWGVLRVKTRLTYRNDPLNFKYPMLLPNNNEEVKKLIWSYHLKYCHAGVGFLQTKLRSDYWIIKARHTIKHVVSKCVRCRRYSSKPIIPEPAPLPLDRIKCSEVYDVVGIDLAGPLVLKTGKKVWMVIFTCAVYRAVHLDLVSSLTTKAFLNVLEKFIEKYRRPSIIYTDNGTNFRGADNLFRQINWQAVEADHHCTRITWKFNPPNSSWWGGWWERLIRTVKDLLRRTIGKGSLQLSELKSVLKKIEKIINQRPLTYVSEDPKDLEPLTPAVFLHPFGNVNFPEAETNVSKRLRFRKKYVETLTEEVRNRFLKEYLAMLVNRKPKKTTRGLKTGELVLVSSDNLKRMEWPLGRVIELIPGRDGVTRLARVRTEKGELTRSVQRLFPLELDTAPEADNALQRTGVVTRSRRNLSQ